MAIKNIIFDYGNVLLNLDPEATVNGFRELLTVDYDFYSGSGLNETFTDFETGSISTDHFINRLMDHAPVGTTEIQLIEIWNKMLLDLPRPRIDMLIRLKSAYNVYLLSNTNEIHIKFANKYLERTYPKINFEKDCFHKVYYSYKMGKRKPNLDIYEVVIKEESLKPDETMFIDDNLANIEAARQLGLLTHHHDPKTDILQVVERLLW